MIIKMNMILIMIGKLTKVATLGALQPEVVEDKEVEDQTTTLISMQVEGEDVVKEDQGEIVEVEAAEEVVVDTIRNMTKIMTGQKLMSMRSILETETKTETNTETKTLITTITEGIKDLNLRKRSALINIIIIKTIIKVRNETTLPKIKVIKAKRQSVPILKLPSKIKTVMILRANSMTSMMMSSSGMITKTLMSLMHTHRSRLMGTRQHRAQALDTIRFLVGIGLSGLRLSP